MSAFRQAGQAITPSLQYAIDFTHCHYAFSLAISHWPISLSRHYAFHCAIGWYADTIRHWLAAFVDIAFIYYCCIADKILHMIIMLIMPHTLLITPLLFYDWLPLPLAISFHYTVSLSLHIIFHIQLDCHTAIDTRLNITHYWYFITHTLAITILLLSPHCHY